MNTNNPQALAAQMEAEAKFNELRERVAEIAQYAKGLDDPTDVDAMLVWLLNEHNDLINRFFAQADYNAQLRAVFGQYQEAYEALLESDTSHPEVERLWDEATTEAEKRAITGLIMKIAINNGINRTDAAALLQSIERPDYVSPFFTDKAAEGLRKIAEKLEAQMRKAIVK